MSILGKLFGRKDRAATPPARTVPPAEVSPADDPSMVRVYDAFGREMFISKQDWRDSVLLGNLEEKRDQPDELFAMLLGALQDGFASDIVPFAEHLEKTDPIASRGASILAIVYMQNDRLDEAENVLNEFLSRHGEDGVVLTNLAKVYSRQGKDSQAEATLWRGLELDPNQDNGLAWYAAIQQERGGEVAASSAFSRVAKLPHSWRAQLWLARDALKRSDVAAAVSLYAQALARVENSAPSDMLMQMSGDLGNHGQLRQIVELVQPHFNADTHGLEVGNNLIKANLDLGNTDSARQLLSQLYAQKRPDWQETLGYWDTELAKAEIAGKTGADSEQPSVGLLAVEGPLWSRVDSPFASLIPSKAQGALSIAVFGSTVLSTDQPTRPEVQLSDTSGRMSRAIPLLIAERIHLHTDATGIALIPSAKNHGLVVFGRRHEDQDLCRIATQDSGPNDFIFSLVVDTTRATWKLVLRLIRTTDCVCIGQTEVDVDTHDPGPAASALAAAAEHMLLEHAGVHAVPPPEWYRPPGDPDFSDYLLRLEQQLAVTSTHLDPGGALIGEREILDGIIHLCLRQPSSELTRMVLTQTLLQMNKVRPSILGEYREKLELLQRQHPLEGAIGKIITDNVKELTANDLI